MPVVRGCYRLRHATQRTTSSYVPRSSQRIGVRLATAGSSPGAILAVPRAVSSRALRAGSPVPYEQSRTALCGLPQ